MFHHIKNGFLDHGRKRRVKLVIWVPSRLQVVQALNDLLLCVGDGLMARLLFQEARTDITRKSHRCCSTRSTYDTNNAVQKVVKIALQDGVGEDPLKLRCILTTFVRIPQPRLVPLCEGVSSLDAFKQRFQLGMRFIDTQTLFDMSLIAPMCLQKILYPGNNLSKLIHDAIKTIHQVDMIDSDQLGHFKRAIGSQNVPANGPLHPFHEGGSLFKRSSHRFIDHRRSGYIEIITRSAFDVSAVTSRAK